jgi:hypothetical protein
MYILRNLGVTGFGELGNAILDSVAIDGIKELPFSSTEFLVFPRTLVFDDITIIMVLQNLRTFKNESIGLLRSIGLAGAFLDSLFAGTLAKEDDIDVPKIVRDFTGISGALAAPTVGVTLPPPERHSLLEIFC